MKTEHTISEKKITGGKKYASIKLFCNDLHL